MAGFIEFRIRTHNGEMSLIRLDDVGLLSMFDAAHILHHAFAALSCLYGETHWKSGGDGKRIRSLAGCRRGVAAFRRLVNGV